MFVSYVLARTGALSFVWKNRFFFTVGNQMEWTFPLPMLLDEKRSRFGGL